jgi:serine/threonine protein kinase
MPSDANRVQAVFLVAVEIGDAAERVRYLAEACGRDLELKSRVEELLRAHAQPDSLLDQPVVAPIESDRTEMRTISRDGGGRPDDDDVPLGFLSPATRPDSLGRIGHYEVLEVLGKGGFGIVFRAFDDVLHRVVAVKVLSPQMAATSPARKRFLREARSSAAIRHDNVVQVYEVGEQPLPYIAMEFIPGETLQQRLDRIGPVEPAEVVRIGRQIADGLAAAHASDLIHRDIKPGNVLIESGAQRVKITDFGLARAADDASISQSGVIAGTPMYMAPEQAKGETLDQRADLFSLGSVLYQMTTGRPPFRAVNTLAVLKRVAEDNPRPIREIIPETPQWLCDIIAKLHAKDPNERFQSAREVADVLADCEAQLKSHGVLRDFSRVPAVKPAAVRRSRRGRWIAVAFVVITALFGLFGRPAWLTLTNRGQLVIEPDTGLISVIVLKNDEGIINANKIHPMVTDWLGMKKPQKLTLPPGKYQLNVSTYPMGTTVNQWEVKASGLFGSRQDWVAVERTSAIITVERGQRVILRPQMLTIPKPPERPAPSPSSDDGWVQLFNGRDLSGWNPPTAAGKWRVENGVLIGSGAFSLLRTTRTNFRDFRFRVESQFVGTIACGQCFRGRLGALSIANGYQARIGEFPGMLRIVGKDGPKDMPSTSERLASGTWYTQEVIAEGDRLQVKVNDKLVADTTNRDVAEGFLGFEIVEGQGEVRIRKIEIKELPPKSPEVPKTAADVLRFIRGTWKSDAIIVEPNRPPEKTRLSGHHTFDPVAGGKVMRGLALDEKGTMKYLVLHSYDNGSDRLHSWFFSYEGEVSVSRAGAYDPTNRTFLWMESFPDRTQSVHHMQFVDTHTVKARNYDMNADSKIVYESRATFNRIDQPVIALKARIDPKRPEEMKVLDPLAGDWQTEITIKPASPPSAPIVESWRSTARPILSGRFIEITGTNVANRASDYAIIWYDPVEKAYRQWYFNSDGHTLAMNGTWDPATKTLTWETLDKTKAGRWVFQENQREFRHTIADSSGKVISEAIGVSRRLNPAKAPSPSVP